jgi:hypothetical protein
MWGPGWSHPPPLQGFLFRKELKTEGRGKTGNNIFDKYQYRADLIYKFNPFKRQP